MYTKKQSNWGHWKLWDKNTKGIMDNLPRRLETRN